MITDEKHHEQILDSKYVRITKTIFLYAFNYEGY